MRYFSFFIFIYLLGSNVKARNTVLFLNGDTMSISSFEEDTVNFLIKYQNKRNKTKFIDIDNVFSITDTTGTEKIYYIPVVMNEDDSVKVSVAEMRKFVQGAFDANYEHKAWGAFGAGVISGFAGVAVTAPAMLFYSPIVPAGVSVLTGFTQPRESKVIKLHPEKENDEYYIRGYQQSAQSKRTNQAIKGGLVGLLLGIAGLLVYSYNN